MKDEEYERQAVVNAAASKENFFSKIWKFFTGLFKSKK
jgi:hypothetical protein